jgi:hypothetical protein
VRAVPGKPGNRVFIVNNTYWYPAAAEAANNSEALEVPTDDHGSDPSRGLRNRFDAYLVLDISQEQFLSGEGAIQTPFSSLSDIQRTIG